MMNRLKALTITLLLMTTLSCASYSAYQKAKKAEQEKDWDTAVVNYEKALEIDSDNRSYKVALDRARREASRVHFEKGKDLYEAARKATGENQYRLAQLASTELQLTIRLDPTNQFAAVEYSKATQILNDLQRAAAEKTSVDEVKKRAQSAISKAQPPQLNPSSDLPISLTFSRDTNVKDIYRALGNAFGINILFDQAVKDDRITIELRDVTAQQALERVMQAANHFYKVLDEKTIIVVPDNPQARRDYEDLVIRTFYLSNGDAEQVTNVVRTMIEARNVFPLKALNAITIRDTADKVRIAEKIIEANDKARAEVVVEVELVELNLTKIRDIGFAVSGISAGSVTPIATNDDGSLMKDDKGAYVPFTGGTLHDIARTLGSFNDIKGHISLAIPTATYSLLKTIGDSELLANPELRISEGEKATLHIGQRIPVPVTTIAGYNPGTTGGGNQNLATPYTSYQYQDVGIKVAMEPRVHHNREVTLKLTVEVSNVGERVGPNQDQPTFGTRTIESTIRLMDGETNFLAGLIQQGKTNSNTKTPFLGDIPFIGRLFTKSSKEDRRTDLVLTMTPHIIRIPDITEEDMAPMWVGTGSNLTFRGVSPRIESQSGNGDPFVAPARDRQFSGTSYPQGMTPSADGEPGNFVTPDGRRPAQVEPGNNPPAGMPNDPFKRPQPNPPPPPPPNPDTDASLRDAGTPAVAVSAASTPAAADTTAAADDVAALRLAPRIGPQPASLTLGPGQSKVWNIIGMDLEGLTANELLFHFDPRSMTVMDVAFGEAMAVDPMLPPVITVDSTAGAIKVRSANGKPLSFVSGGLVLGIRVNGGVTGETYLVMESPDLRNGSGKTVVAAIAGGRVKVE